MLCRGQHGGGVGTVGDDGRHPELVGPPARERERHVGQRQVLVAREFGGKRGPGILQGLGGARGQQQHLRTARGRAGGEVRGASSTTTCTLVPPTPNELTPARRGASDSQAA